ncbi:NAD-dependent deacylase [Palleronia sp.]|uniref:NAD-dependent deacylase n=1 Tax=Palleronia sp. TaxID=1940284 RepID=UPI0035C82150
MIFILTGAGLSAESGLGTFRDKSGLWTEYDLKKVATPEGYAADPSTVLDFYNARRANAASAEPNAAHHALARLQAARETFIVTQNVDTLLDRAGATQVLHMHGRLDRVRCNKCGARWDAPEIMDPFDHCGQCGAQTVRPDVVWFGEMPHGLDKIEDKLTRASLFVAIGTSGTVYPAAGFVEMATAHGIPTLELNLEPSGGVFDEGHYGPATKVVPAWVNEITA